MESCELDRPARASLSAIAAAVGAGTPCARLARRFWQADLLVHFRLQYVVASFAVGLVLAWTGRLLSAVVLLLVCGFNALTAWGALAQSVRAGFTESAHASNAMQVRFAAYNVLYRNRDPRRAMGWLRAAALDVVLLQEVTPRWCDALLALAEQFPHRYYSAAWIQRLEGAAGRGAL